MHLSAFEHEYIKHHGGYGEERQAMIADIFRRTADKECLIAGVGNATQASPGTTVQTEQLGAVAACAATSTSEAPRPSIVAVIPFHAPSCTGRNRRSRRLGIEIFGKGKRPTEQQSGEKIKGTTGDQVKEKCTVGAVPKNQGNAHSVVDPAVKYDYLRSTLCSLKPWVDKAFVVVMGDEADSVRREMEAWPFAGGDGAQRWLHVATVDQKRHAFCGQPKMLPVCTLQLLKDGIPGGQYEQPLAGARCVY